MKWWSGLSNGKKVGVVIAGLFVVAAMGGSAQKSQTNLGTTDFNSATGRSGVDVSKQQPIDTTETKTETKTEVVPFESTTKNDAALASGTTKISTIGVNGERTIAFKVTYKNGIETGREQLSDTVTKQPISQVTSVGTHQELNCPNGTYINASGNEVCSPYSAPSVPAGATARCGDGTYSFSQSRSGTCSHHGGVASWL